MTRRLVRGSAAVARLRRASMVVLGMSTVASGGRAQEPVPVLTIGAASGPEVEVFGHIVDVAVARNGDVFVLDNQALEVRWFDSTGAFRGRAGGGGSGPGELRSPQALALDSAGHVLVLDPLNGRIARYRPTPTNLEHVTDLAAPPAMEMCALNGRLYLLRLREDSLITVLDSDGRIIDSWGSMIEPLPEHEAPPDDIRRELDNRARMLCDPATSTVTLLHERIPVVRRFDSAGSPLWEVELIDYRQVRDVRTPDESGWMPAPDPETGTAHSGRSVVAGGEGTLVVTLYEGSADGGTFEARVLSAADGGELTRTSVPMAIEAVREVVVTGYVNSPFPHVIRFDRNQIFGSENESRRAPSVPESLEARDRPSIGEPTPGRARR